MFDWIANRVFGPFFDALLAWAPWLWLLACVIVAGYLFLAMRPLFKRSWQAILVVAIAGFAALWLWQHFDGIADLAKKNEELTQQNADLEERVGNLDTSIKDYETAIGALERRQRQISSEIAQARVGLNSETIREEATNDPGQAAVDLSDRWNRFGRMSDEATSGFGRPTSAAASPGGDTDAGT